MTTDRTAKFFLVVGIVLFATIFFSGCGSVFSQEFGACMAGKGIQVASGLPAKVDNILSNADQKDTAVAALEGLAGGAVSDIVSCWLQAHPLPAHASAAQKLLIGRAAAEAYLAKAKK